MKVISTNIGKPREVLSQGEPVQTGIYKEPVEMISVKKFFVEGDTVSDPTVHGGEFKAVYGYASEHYEFWRKEFPKMKMPWGTFGENITTEGMLEEEVMAGSLYRIGSALLQVTQPRMPCFKLAMKFGTSTMIRRFMKSGKSGFYFTVIEEGIIRPGDQITLAEKDASGCSILDMVNDAMRSE